ncbi:hypothetical protein BGW38_008347, partial [Lunasporangiospora selenospora]
FLSPGDLWRLSQVSRSMRRALSHLMTRDQQYKFNLTRILHQEHQGTGVPPTLLDLRMRPTRRVSYTHKGTRSDEHSAGSTYGAGQSQQEGPQVFRSRSPRKWSIRKSLSYGPVQSRSEYWSAQAESLVGTMTEGTPFASKAEDYYASLLTTAAAQNGTLCDAPGMDAGVYSTIEMSGSSSALLTAPSSGNSTEEESSEIKSPLPSRSTMAELVSTLPNKKLKALLKGYGVLPPPLPLGRFQAVVDMIFDPNLVHLSNRRATINCARYLSAEIDDAFYKAVRTHQPLHPEFCATMARYCSVDLGPYLSIASLRPHSTESITVVQPPKRLKNYFQQLLWHRCLSDLITLYGQIQRRHTQPIDTPTTKDSHVCSNQANGQDESYPFCCQAHSLVFTTLDSGSTGYPSSFRLQVRRIVQRIQSTAAAQKNAFLSATTLVSRGNRGGVASARRRVIQAKGFGPKLQFCNSRQSLARPYPFSASPVALLLEAEQLDPLAWQHYSPENEALVQRRYRIEEQLRQDTHTKQELLSLCHMACGLFLVDENSMLSAGVSPTIMTLLRQNSPWNKGVWREGEWRQAPVELSQGEGSTRLSADASDEVMDQGKWQELCLATIQFLVHEDLAWGGNRTNVELSRLKSTSYSSAWVYHQ